MVTQIVLAVVRCQGLICLARRSHDVATGRGLWSVVTGYLEDGVLPLEQACVEIQEELGLSSNDVHLVRALAALPLTSAASGKRFLVHPFLFESQGSCQVVLNWEHTAFEWVDPARLADADCVNWQRAVVQALLSQS